MQNIDPLYFLMPFIVIGLSVGLVLFWHFKRCFSRWALIYSLIAYAGAIILKELVQIPTYNLISHDSLFVLGVYFGAQTAAFEVGGAYLVSSYAVRKGQLSARDRGAYGIGLAFWENGVLIGGLTLINYITYYAILSAPGLPAAQILYSSLSKNAPSLFYPPPAALPLIAFSILERVSSLLAHFAWGFLAISSLVYKRKSLLAVAFPLGFLIDFLTPFAPPLGLALFEGLVFVVALGGLLLAMAMVKAVRRTDTLETNSEEPTSQRENQKEFGKKQGV